MLIPVNKAYTQAVLRVVCAVPAGKVVTYGQVAELAGYPRTARQVGMLLRGLGNTQGNTIVKNVPWQRVINARGELSTFKIGAGQFQRDLLRAEGVVVSDDGQIDLKTYRWKPDPEALQSL